MFYTTEPMFIDGNKVEIKDIIRILAPLRTIEDIGKSEDKLKLVVYFKKVVYNKLHPMQIQVLENLGAKVVLLSKNVTHYTEKQVANWYRKRLKKTLV